MKHQFKLLFSFSLVFLLGASTAMAQFTISNSQGIYPSGIFNPLGKYTAIGESGGTPGTTVDGCDLYGFRAQTALNSNVNLGIATRTLNIGPIGGGPTTEILLTTPTLLWGDNKRLDFVAKGTGSNGSNTGCGQRTGYFFNSPFSSNTFFIYGSGTAIGGMWQASDQRLKQNVSEIPNALDIVRQLDGVVYEYQNEKFPDLNLPQGKQYGFITQKVKEIMPMAVRDADTDELQETEFQVMQYTQIIPVLTEGMKEQQDIIDSQQDLLTQQLEIILALEERMERLENIISSSNTELPALDNAATISYEGVSLRQNRPNPFKGQTVIDYTVPSDMNNSQLVIYDLNGKALSSFNLEAGNGQVTLNAADLSSGVYFYAIENNGQTIARQKMIVK